jgi:hypothetical protein
MPLFRFRLSTEPFREITVTAEDIHAAERDLLKFARSYAVAYVNKNSVDLLPVTMTRQGHADSRDLAQR